jgi:thioredoxin-related protein
LNEPETRGNARDEMLFFQPDVEPMNFHISRFSTVAFAVLVLSAAPALAAPGEWTFDFPKALKEAQTENKAVLLDFTGSDWCPWCKLTKLEALDTDVFRDYAKKNLVLVTVDFPDHTRQSLQLQEQNRQLHEKYGQEAFPTFIVLSKDGKELGRQDGYVPVDGEAFVAMIKKFYHAPRRS